MINLTKTKVSESQDLFTSLGNIRSRSQFGGYSLSANGVMFALVSDGYLYLRATPENEMHFRRMGMESLIYRKRGIAIALRYFKVDEKLWQDTAQLLTLAKSSLQGMLDDIKTKKDGEARLKDLPNISLNLERLLWQVGVSTSSQLRAQGACETYLKLRTIKSNLGLNVLLALEAAIQGFHHAALPMASREVLMKWFTSHEPMIDTTAR